jgi:hypothetical protein
MVAAGEAFHFRGLPQPCWHVIGFKSVREPLVAPC